VRVRKIVIIVVAILLVGVSFFFQEFNRLYTPIDVSKVQKIELWGQQVGEVTRREATNEEVSNIVKWFNSTTDIRENKDFAGETPAAGIVINLKYAPDIRILRSGRDFEVQRVNWLGINKSYWTRQSDIKRLLDQLVNGSGV